MSLGVDKKNKAITRNQKISCHHTHCCQKSWKFQQKQFVLCIFLGNFENMPKKPKYAPSTLAYSTGNFGYLN